MRRPALVMLACACPLAGCGGGKQEAAAGPPVTTTVEKGLSAVAREYAFKPKNVVVTGAGELKITLDNRGSLAHNLKLERDGRVLGGSPTFPGGEKRSGTVSITPGAYRMVCTVGNHEQLGMTGALEVRR
jgi:plastocyanin